MSNQKDQQDQNRWSQHFSPRSPSTLSSSEFAALQATANFLSEGQRSPQMSSQSQYPVEQPTFPDLMRELRYEESDALHEAARTASSNAGSYPMQGYQPGVASSFAGNDPRNAPSPYSGEFISSPIGSSGPSPASNHSSPPNQPGTSGTRRQTSTRGEEPGEFEMFPCDLCSASFSRRHDLERHRRGHSGEAPYTCLGCSSAFTRSDGRGRHWKLHPECEQKHYQSGGTGRKNAKSAGTSTGTDNSGSTPA
ncbi:hypothetical protein FRC18_007689 [Serendipita sp. 400]|nr:hypothetical protein FRC18_007689 [Serendipita sp. 400]